MAVTLVTAVVYLAVFIPLLIIHETVPSAPEDPTVYRGLNLTEAWLDLAELSNGYHPFNSRRNDDVRNWLLRRVEEILDNNGVKHEKGENVNAVPDDSISSNGKAQDVSIHSGSGEEEPRVGSADRGELGLRAEQPAAVVFNDLVSNYTSNALTSIGVSGPFEASWKCACVVKSSAMLGPELSGGNAMSSITAS